MELLVTISLASILFVMAGLNFYEYMTRSRQKETARTFEAELWNVRNAARTSQRSVYVHITSNLYTAFIDNDGDGSLSDGDVRLTMISVVPPVEVQGASGLSLPCDFSFTATGRPSFATSAQFVIVQTTDLKRQYKLTIYPTGITHVEISGNSGASWQPAW